MNRLLFSVLTAAAISISAHAATERTGAFHMPIGCTLEIGLPYNGGQRAEGDDAAWAYLGYKRPGQRSISMFQSLLVFPGTERAVADAVCVKSGFLRAESFKTYGSQAETSVLIVDQNLQVFTHEDSDRDLRGLANIVCAQFTQP